MLKSLRWRWILIFVVIVGCIFGITGLPKSPGDLVQNLTRNIRLGLDLKGGSHIVLQIQVQDAFKADADTAIESLRQALQKGNITYVSMERNDPASIQAAETIQISIRGVAAAQSGEFRRIANDLAPHEAHGEWMGLAKLTARGSALVRAELEAMRADGTLARASLLDLFSRLLAAGHEVPVVYALGNWLDVDDAFDLARARNFL